MEAVPFEFPAPAIPFVVTAAHAAGVAVPLRVLFDTGNAAPFALVIAEKSPLAARAAPTGGKAYVARATAGGGAAAFRPARLADFRLGPFSLSQASVGVSPAVDIVAARLPGGLDAVIGQELVRGRVVRIDYPARRIDFSASRGPARAALPMELAPRRPLSVISVTVNGKGPFRMAIDTAAGSTILSPGAAERAGVGHAGPAIRLGGAGGTASPGRIESASLAAGANNWTTLVVVSDIVGPVAAEAGTAIDGILGAPLFASGQLTLDYRRRQVWIEQPREPAPAKGS